MRLLELIKRKPDLIRYIITGFTTVFVDVGLLYLLASSHMVPLVWAATISFWTSLAVNFGLSKMWTFGVRKNTMHHAVLYGALIFVNYLFGLAMIGLAEQLHINYLIGKVAALAITTCWNFLLYKHVIFVDDRKAWREFAASGVKRVAGGAWYGNRA